MIKKKIALLKNDEIELYNWLETRDNVRNFFTRYRSYTAKVQAIEDRYNATLSNDNLGIYSSIVSNPTESKVERMEKYQNYIDEMNIHLKQIKKNLVDDEKIILNLSILDNYTDEEISVVLCMDRQNVYPKKKSCYIKVARYFDLDVEKD